MDIPSVLAKVQAAEPGSNVTASSDAGLYLCEYTYYFSLHSNPAPTLFIHIPPFDKPLSPAVSNNKKKKKRKKRKKENKERK